jgi:hypothetical protein
MSFTPRPLYPLEKKPPVPIRLEAGWVPEPIWMIWRNENSWPYRNSNSEPSVIQSVASRYTDCAISAPHVSYDLHKIKKSFSEELLSLFIFLFIVIKIYIIFHNHFSLCIYFWRKLSSRVKAYSYFQYRNTRIFKFVLCTSAYLIGLIYTS